jgi:hypothetical protein
MNRVNLPAALRVIGNLKRLAKLQDENVAQLDRILRHKASDRQAKLIDRVKHRLKPRSAMLDRIERSVRRAARARERLLKK